MSYQSLNYLSTKEEEKEHEQEWGRFNDPLPNMEEITLEEFAQSGFFIWSVTGVEYRQINPALINKEKLISPVNEYFSVKIFYTNGTTEDGFALSSDYWSKKVRVFKFAKCYHTGKELGGSGLGNCLHVYKCTKCGCTWEVDSSD